MAGIDSYVKAMLHFNGVDASTTITDSSSAAHTFTAAGTTQIDTAQSKFGGASLLTNSSYVYSVDSADWNFGSGDFTIDFWVQWNSHTSNSGNQAFCGRPTGGTSYFYFALEGGTGLRFRDYQSGDNINIQCSFTPSDSTWYHIAAVRSSGVIKIYVNGVSQTLTANTTPGNSFIARTDNLQVGTETVINYALNGWMDEFRWSKGIARWTTDFTPPTVEYTTSDVTVTVSELTSTSAMQAPVTLNDYTLFASVLNSVTTIQPPVYPTSTNILMDIRWGVITSQLINFYVNTLNAAILNTDIRWAALTSIVLGTDIRFNAIAPGGEEVAISRLDFHVFINNVEATDVKMDAINIYHTDYEKSRATFVLARKHDDLDFTLTGANSEITNQNPVRIEINGHIEFEGFIWDIDCQSETENVSITAYSVLPKIDERSLVTLSLPSINETLKLGHALVHNPKIEKPKLLVDDYNPDIFTGILMDMGYYEEQNISRWSSFENVQDVAAQVTAGTLVPKQNWSYFWFAQASNFITNQSWATLNYIGTSPASLTSDTFEITGMAYKYQREFLPKKIRLGDGIVYVNDFKFVSLAPAQQIFDALVSQAYIDVSGNILQRFKDAVVGYDVNFNPVIFDLGLYIPGTGITSSTLNKNVMDIVDGKLGYTLGTAPFKKISSKTGRLVASDRWQDKPDGLYIHHDASYDFVNVVSVSDTLPATSYLYQVAALEFKKLQNINGDVLPKTSADIEIFIDAYYYNNIQLLKRINIDNTTRLNIYKNNNGFPLEVKSIDINSSTMKVTLHCDNQWSRTEMLEFESQYPNPDDTIYSFPETNERAFVKFDPKTGGNVQ